MYVGSLLTKIDIELEARERGDENGDPKLYRVLSFIRRMGNFYILCGLHGTRRSRRLVYSR
jgi:hypothetical protein